MFFLGAQIPQDEHGRCTLLPANLVSSHRRIASFHSTHPYALAYPSSTAGIAFQYGVARSEDSRKIRAGAWPMSGVYWGIVTGLLARVGPLFVCIDLLYGAQRDSLHAPGNQFGESNQTVGSASTGSCQVA